MSVLLWWLVCITVLRGGGDTADCQLHFSQKTRWPLQLAWRACSCVSGLGRAEKPSVADFLFTSTHLKCRKRYLFFHSLSLISSPETLRRIIEYSIQLSFSFNKLWKSIYLKLAKCSMRAKVCLMFFNVFWASEESEMNSLFLWVTMMSLG